LIAAGEKNGRGGWIRTNAWQDQNLLPYRLATPLYLSGCTAASVMLAFAVRGVTEKRYNLLLQNFAVWLATGRELYQLRVRLGRPQTSNCQSRSS
tara:strand:+ start:139 stop:423 length:285 start_codon:yes stop_codon:yes gene_type:complete